MDTFNEKEHPRDKNGQWVNKHQSVKPDIELSLATPLPDWFANSRTIVLSPKQLPEYHKRYYDALNDDVKEYIDTALANDCGLVYEYRNANSFSLAKTANIGGETVVFIQLAGQSAPPPTSYTFMYRKNFNDYAKAVNRCKQCEGIPIWDTEQLVTASLVCGECGKKFTSLKDMHSYPFAGLGCEVCAAEEQAYFEKNQLWR